MARGAADQHACSKDRLGASAVSLRVTSRDHRLCGGGVRGFADADEGAREQQHREGVDMARRDGGEAPENYAAGNDAAAVEAVGEEAEGDAGQRQDRLQGDLEIADLRAAESEFIPNQRD